LAERGGRYYYFELMTLRFRGWIYSIEVELSRIYPDII
jgi:hypothetical protein